MAEPAITVEKVNKIFRIPHERRSSLKQSAVHLFRNASFTRLDAVKDVSFTINKGEFFGIVGRNGSGKSTLLKMLAKIYEPSSGTISVDGTLSPFIELGVGFNPELTARENIYLSGTILGLSRAMIDERFSEIIAFAELEEFIDQRLKNFSSGMQVRLAFSIAIQAQSDILLIDEVLAVGDASFQRKCYDTFKRIKKSGKTVVFVSHDMGAVQEYCDRAVLLEHGVLIEEGDSGQIARHYNRVNIAETQRRSEKAEPGDRWGNQAAVISKMHASQNGKTGTAFEAGAPLTISMKVKANRDVAAPVFGITMKTVDGNLLFATNTKIRQMKIADMKKGEVREVSFELEGIFNNGTYLVSPAVASGDASMFYDWIEGGVRFSIGGSEAAYGVVQPKHTITIKAVK